MNTVNPKFYDLHFLVSQLKITIKAREDSAHCIRFVVIYDIHFISDMNFIIAKNIKYNIKKMIFNKYIFDDIYIIDSHVY